MKKNLFNKLSILFLPLIFLSFSSESTLETTDDLAFEILTCIEQNNKEKLLSLIVTEQDFIVSVDKSKMDEQEKERFKKLFSQKWQEDQDKTKETILRGFEDIVQAVKQRKVSMMSYGGDARPLDNLPTIELGELEVRFKAKRTKLSFNVEIIRTVNGWRILEKLRLAH